MKNTLTKCLLPIIAILLFVIGCSVSKENLDSDNTEESQTVALFSDINAVKSVNILFPKEISLDYNGQEWETNSLTGIDQEAVSEIFTRILALQGVLDNEIDLNNMNEGELVFSVEFIDGENDSSELHIYKSEEKIYGKLNDEKDIYKISSPPDEILYFQPSLLKESIPLNVEEVTEIIISENNKEDIILNRTTEMNEIETSPFISGWYLHGVYETEFSIEYRNMEKLLYTLENIKGTLVETDVNLEESAMVISVSDGQNMDHLYIGPKDIENNTYRVFIDSTNILYEVPIFFIEQFFFEPIDIVDNFVSVIPLDAIQEIVIEQNGKETLNIGIDHNLVKKGEETVISSTFYMNGVVVEEDSFRRVYQHLASLSYEQEIIETMEIDESSTDRIKIGYHYKNEGKDIRSEILLQSLKNQDAYAVSKDGITEFITNKEEVEEMLEQFDHL